jgi:oligogalacturonide lyase
MRGLVLILSALCALWASAVAAEPGGWIDPATGHRIIRISTEPGAYSLYFNEEAYTPQGDKMVIASAEGISVVDLNSWAVSALVKGNDLQLLFVGRKARTVYYAVHGPVRPGGAAGKDGEVRSSAIWAADIDNGRRRLITELSGGSIASINADETLLAGQMVDRAAPLQPGQAAQNTETRQANYAAVGPDGKPLSFAEAKEVRLNERLESRVPNEIFTIDIRTGERRTVIRSTDWLNHLLFSPTDPSLLMYCHEGPWHKVDRIWTIHIDGSGLTRIHTRTMNMEIAGHEFWAPDGKSIWYDLQTPRGEVFWLANYDLATGKRRWYAVDRNEWSVHFNISDDQTLFSGDGGDSEMVAHAPDGKYLYLFHPRSIPDVAGIHAPDSANLIAPGTLDSEKLVDMSRHDYRLEPNARFTPDGKWLVFRSNLEGKVGVYAVEIAKASLAGAVRP